MIFIVTLQQTENLVVLDISLKINVCFNNRKVTYPLMLDLFPLKQCELIEKMTARIPQKRIKKLF